MIINDKWCEIILMIMKNYDNNDNDNINNELMIMK